MSGDGDEMTHSGIPELQNVSVYETREELCVNCLDER